MSFVISGCTATIFVHRYIALPSKGKMAGDIFEEYCHVKFSTMFEFEFVPMVRIGSQKAVAAKEPQWHSSVSGIQGIQSASARSHAC
jgi:hypothetical protein